MPKDDEHLSPSAAWRASVYAALAGLLARIEVLEAAAAADDKGQAK